MREYAYTVTRLGTKEGKDESYYLAVGPGGAIYNQIESKIAMSRKHYRTKAARPSAITFTRRVFDQAEAEEHMERRKRLMGPNDQLRLTGPTASTADAADADGGAAADADGGADGFEMDDDDRGEPGTAPEKPGTAPEEQPLLQDADPAAEPAAAASDGEGEEGEEGDGMVVDDDDDE